MTREEGLATRDFLTSLLSFPYLCSGVIALLFWCYAIQLVLGWPFFTILPVSGNPLDHIYVEVLGARLGWLSRDAVVAGDYWRLLSSSMLHGSLLHVVANCFVLFHLGRIVENCYGRTAFAVTYVGAGIVGACLSVVASGVDSLGASGAVLGMLGAALVLGIRYRMQIPRPLRDTFGLDLWAFALLIGIFSALPFVDWAGHLGGFLWGLTVGLIWPARIFVGAPGLLGRSVGNGMAGLALGLFLGTLLIVGNRASTVGDHLPDANLRALEFAVDRGDVEAQLAAAQELVSSFPEVPELQLQLAAALLQAEQWEASSTLMLQVEGKWPAVVQIDPYYDNNLAWALFLAHPEDRDVIEEGLARVRRNLRQSPDDPIMRNTLAYGLYLDGQFERAERVLSDVMAAKPRKRRQNDVFLHVLTLLALGRGEEAAAEFVEFAQDFSEGEFREAARDALEAAGLLSAKR